MTSVAEKTTRQILTDCFHLLAKFGWTDLIYTHITARVPDEDAMLINPFGYLFEQVTPDNLVKVSFEGEILDSSKKDYFPLAGYIIHSAIHKARLNVNCVIHTHSTTAMAISALKCGLLPITQHALRFYNRIAYHDYHGLAFDPEEQPSLIRDLGDHKAMILRNHGFITVGRSIPEAFTLLHFLEKAAQAQLKAQATNAKLIKLPHALCEKTAQQFGDEGETPRGDYEWNALIRALRS